MSVDKEVSFRRTLAEHTAKGLGSIIFEEVLKPATDGQGAFKTSYLVRVFRGSGVDQFRDFISTTKTVGEAWVSGWLACAEMRKRKAKAKPVKPKAKK